ncbi:SMP-30/gluconolactonase/LRE family protein [Agromyces marinus]|uniref:Gluconolactonase n=1 Tax=Agromyces marinus TaxID=1389020 RepID=A0ABN6YEP1_9MICO|nr:SMP-30/gluconolactonase/LRE family protein [Agromyces marinus]UIP57381.1 Gluconolactonase [Agromyces marinus]BDZ54510.1 gluconolactonase [Agromyces marinus]
MSTPHHSDAPAPSQTPAASSLIAPGAELEALCAGAAWAEGPVWLASERRVRFSDIPNDRILEWDAATGEQHVFRTGAEFANGRALDRDGTVLQCSHGRRAIERETEAGPVPVATRWAQGRFNSPNDLAVASDRSIWFTDPPYGLHPSGREGRPGPQDYDGCHVFRIPPDGSAVAPVVTSMVHPNGIAFSPDERHLYVADTGFYGDRPDAKHIMRFPVDGAAVTGPGEVFARVPVGASDGLTIDREGRLWSSAGDGVYVYAPDGGLVEHVPVPETVSNLTFGGDDGHDLFITATTTLYRIRTTTTAPTLESP